jgi:hypothetical protein
MRTLIFLLGIWTLVLGAPPRLAAADEAGSATEGADSQTGTAGSDAPESAEGSGSAVAPGPARRAPEVDADADGDATAPAGVEPYTSDPYDSDPYDVDPYEETQQGSEE